MRVLRFRSAGLEGLRAYDVARLFELARMSAQIAVAHVEQGLEFVEGEPLVHGQRAHDAEAYAFVNQAIESRILIPVRRARHGSGFRRRFARGRCGRFAVLDGTQLSRHESSVRSGSRR